MKKTITILMVIISLFSLAACQKSYRNDVAVGDIATEVKSALTDNSFSKLDNSQLIYRLDDEALVEKVAQSNIEYNGENYDEFAIIKADSQESAQQIRDKIKSYYFPMKDELMKNYNPDLYTKISGAVCESFGNYVFYAILSQDDRKTAGDVVENVLSE